MANNKENNSQNNIQKQLLKELNQTISTEDECKITKGQALIKSMVNEALKGDQRMMTNVLKFIEKLDTFKFAKNKADEQCKEKLPETDYEIILRYYAKNRRAIEKDIEKRYKEDPNAWYFYKKYMK